MRFNLRLYLKEADPIAAGMQVDFEEREADPSKYHLQQNIHPASEMDGGNEGMAAPYDGTQMAGLPGGGGAGAMPQEPVSDAELQPMQPGMQQQMPPQQMEGFDPIDEFLDLILSEAPHVAAAGGYDPNNSANDLNSQQLGLMAQHGNQNFAPGQFHTPDPQMQQRWNAAPPPPRQEYYTPTAASRPIPASARPYAGLGSTLHNPPAATPPPAPAAPAAAPHPAAPHPAAPGPTATPVRHTYQPAFTPAAAQPTDTAANIAGVRGAALGLNRGGGMPAPAPAGGLGGAGRADRILGGNAGPAAEPGSRAARILGGNPGPVPAPGMPTPRPAASGPSAMPRPAASGPSVGPGGDWNPHTMGAPGSVAPFAGPRAGAPAPGAPPAAAPGVPPADAGPTRPGQANAGRADQIKAGNATGAAGAAAGEEGGVMNTLRNVGGKATRFAGRVAAPIAGGVAGAEDYNQTHNLGHAATVGTGTAGGAWGGAAAGAAAGAGLGAFGGPLAPVTVPLGGLVGGAVGGYYGAKAGGWGGKKVADAAFGNGAPATPSPVASAQAAPPPQNAPGHGPPVQTISSAQPHSPAGPGTAATLAAHESVDWSLSMKDYLVLSESDNRKGF